MNFVVFVISIFFYSNFINANPPQLCNGVRYTGDAIDDETGETIFEYSFVMKIILESSYTPACSRSLIEVKDFNITYLQQNSSNLKFHGFSYTEKYQGCNLLTNIEESVDFYLPDQEIKFILTFIEGDKEEISGNDLCQNNKTRFVDTITVYTNCVNIFNAETGQFFDDDLHNIFTKDKDELMDKNFLNGSKSVECISFEPITVPDAAEEICTNFEGNVTFLNIINYCINNDDAKIGQFLYSIDSEFINFSLNSTEDWYIYILPYCIENATECLITLPTDDFQYPVQLVTSFGNFYIGYMIRRAGIFLKDNYIFHYGDPNWFSEDTFTLEEPCVKHSFLYNNINGAIDSIDTLICCTKFDRNASTTTSPYESTKMTHLTSDATAEDITTTHFTEAAHPPRLCNGVTYTGDAIDDETGERILTYNFMMIMPFNDSYPINNSVQIFDFSVTFLQESNLKFHHLSYTEKYLGCNSLTHIQINDNFNIPDQEIKFILTFVEDDEDVSGDICQSNKTRFVDTITIFLNYVNLFNAETGQIFVDFYLDGDQFTKDDDKPVEKNFLKGNKSAACNGFALLTVPDVVGEICTNFEIKITVLPSNNHDNEVGQILYSIDLEFINVSLHSSEDWYMYVLPYCMDNSTTCEITLPPIEEDFEYPIQLVTSFGNFYIGYIIRRNGIFLKDNYILHFSGIGSYSEDTFTFKDPCGDHTFSFQHFDGKMNTKVCCTKFDRDWPTTTTPPDEPTDMSTLISETTYSSSSNIITTTSTSHALNKSSKKPPIIWIISGSIFGLLIILLIILYFYRKKRQQRRTREIMPSNVGTNILQNLRPDFSNFLLPKISQTATDYDEFEIEWNKLIFTTSILGAGAFGHIIQGKIINGSTKNGIYEHDFIDVAIKMPQKTASDSICAAFLDEIKLMKKINGNKNIIKMYGYVLQGPRICLILEYCRHKDLLHYCKQLKDEEKRKQTEKEFFIFTWQISHGMQFLASKNIIHCDIAARNILIDKDKNAKISDFGLSVQLESTGSVIVKSDTGKLPIKWLSIETLKFKEFSLNSDIWSFGVLLYEMYSFGNTPYAEIDDYSDLLQHLEAGNRLEKPVFCLDKIYNLMLKCWNSDPTLRPSINELIETFKEFLEESTEGYGYITILNE